MKEKKRAAARAGPLGVTPELEEKAFEEGFQMIGRTGRNDGLGRIVRYLNIKYLAKPVVDDGAVVDLVLPAPEEMFSERRFRRYCAKRLGGIPLPAYKRALREMQKLPPESRQIIRGIKKEPPMA